MTNPVYHTSPAPSNTTLPIADLPQGTIFMFGWSFDYRNGEENEYPYPVPHNYFRSHIDAYKASLSLFNAKDETAQLIHAPTDNDMPYIFELEDGLFHKPVYIYVWAISPAAVGGG